MSDIIFEIKQRVSSLGTLAMTSSEPGAVPSSHVLDVKMDEVRLFLARLGLRGAERYYPEGLSGVTAPMVHATYEGHDVYVCFPTMADDFFELSSMPLECAEYCEKRLPGSVVCYACFFLGFDAGKLEVVMMGCRVVRADGKWQHLPGYEEYIPFEKRSYISRLDAVFGPVAMPKCSRLVDEALRFGEDVNFGVEGLFGERESNASRVIIRSHPGTPHFLVQGEYEAGSGRFKHVANWFAMEYPEQLSLVRVKEVTRGRDGRGILILEDMTRAEIHADCLECTVVPSAFRAGQHFLGNVVLYATRLSLAPQVAPQRVSGNYYGGYVDRSRYKTRSFVADAGQTAATATGRVESIQWLDLGFTKLAFITLQCMSGNDDFHLHVYARPEVLSGDEPKEGDTLTCSGFVQFVCTRLV